MIDITRPIACITGMGSAVPEGRLTNAELEKTLDTTDEWITDRTGIRCRHIARPDESMLSYTLKAAYQAMEQGA